MSEEQIQNLTETAKNLNDWKGSISLITDMEDEILGTQIELEVWLPKCIYEECEMDFDFDEMCGGIWHSNEPHVYVRRWHEIGWAKVDSKWRLAFRTHETRSGRESPAYKVSEMTQGMFVGSLKNAPRPIRNQALLHLESLIRELITEAERHLRTIKRLEEPFLDNGSEHLKEHQAKPPSA